jgi:predicted dienelactone hydrolase
VQARVTEGLDVDVIYPSDSQGAVDRSGAPYPVIVFVQGGLVTVQRYQWLTAHLASRGYVVLAPHHQLDLPVLEVETA